MDNALVQKLKDAISKSQNIGIVAPSNHSLDHMAAALSLNLLFKNIKKNATVATASDPLVEVSSLVGINKVQKSLEGDAGNLVVSFPYLEGEIEKVTYTIENDHLNIVVKASEQGLSFEDKDVKYTRGTGAIDLLVVIGVQQLNEINEVLDLSKLSGIKIINIDNHSANQGFGDIVFVTPNASSICEQIGDLALTLGFQINTDVAQNLFSGISHATNNFQEENTSSLAFEIAGIMMRQGAKRTQHAQPVRPDARDAEQVRADIAGFMPKLGNDQSARPQGVRTQPQPQQPIVIQPGQPQAKPQVQPPVLPKTFEADFREDEYIEDDPSLASKPPVDWLAPKVYKGSSSFEG